MSSVMCQGLQACLEPWLRNEPTLLGSPKTEFLPMRTESPPQSKLVPPVPAVYVSDSNTDTTLSGPDSEGINGKNSNASDPELGIWSSVQFLTGSPKEENKQGIYIHPLAKRSSSTLSEKSLELCTESLGCESGTELSDKAYFSSYSYSSDSSSDESEINFQARERVNHRRAVCRRTGDFRAFPPPLTSISGRDSVHVWSHRQDGRLVLKAVAAPLPRTYFQAQRTGGRLMLSFLTNPSQETKVQAAKEDEEQESTDEEEKEAKAEINVFSVENKENSDDGDEGNNDNYNNNNSSGEMGVGQFQRPSRCKEGGHESNKGMKIWKPFWVATS